VRKRIIAPVRHYPSIPTESWINLVELATVEVISEQPGFPIDSVLMRDSEVKGWRAAENGTQTIRLIFLTPQRITRIGLLFENTEGEHTQEFVLRSTPDGEAFQEIVRQQWTFSSTNASGEIENYKVDLPEVSVVEMIIVPDNQGRVVRASMLTFLPA
jgi:hypothetical protein